MNPLHDIAKRMVAPPKGILAGDASSGTMNKRLAAAGLPEDDETRRRYRELLFTTPRLEEYISGVILYEKTVRQVSDDGISFLDLLSSKGIMWGIKIDQSLKDDEQSPGEKLTKGLDTLDERLKEYKEMGAVFTKWRAVITIDDNKHLPTDENILRNVDDLAQYAAIVQKAGLVPMVEPEVLITGAHTIQRSEEVTTKTLSLLTDALKKHSVDIPAVILKTSMVVAGDSCPQASADLVADATMRTLRASVPQDIGGVVFLSGGQSPEEAVENLNKIIHMEDQPYEVTYSFSRAFHGPVVPLWNAKDENKEKAQALFIHRLKMGSLARMGNYSPEMESEFNV